MRDWTIRPMRASDVAEVERMTDEAFHRLDVATSWPGDPAPLPRDPAAAAGWLTKTRHQLSTDPDGCWIAEDSTGIVGVVMACLRDRVWLLSLLVVRHGAQGGGIGRSLLQAGTEYGAAAPVGMITASPDPRAARRYRLAGFDLHPALAMRGVIDRSAIPAVRDVREGGPGDLDLLESLDRRHRGSGHGVDHELLLRSGRLYVLDGEGYAYAAANGALDLLAASSAAAASDLLWTVLAEGPEETRLGNVTAANQWALDVGLAARLEPRQRGYLCLRGLEPPAPYVHHGAVL